MKTYDIYAKQDGKWQRKGIQGEPTPPECGGSVEGTAIPVGVPVEKIYFNTALPVEETNAYLSQLTYVQTDLVEMPVYCICYIDINEYPIVIFAQKTTNDLGTSYQIIVLDGEDAFEIYNSNTEIDVITNGGFVTIGGGIRTCILTNGVYLANHIVQGDFMGFPVGAENEKIKNVLSITPFGASGGSGDVEDSGLPVEVSTQEEIDALAIGTIFKYTGESGTYENGALYIVEEGE